MVNATRPSSRRLGLWRDVAVVFALGVGCDRTETRSAAGDPSPAVAATQDPVQDPVQDPAHDDAAAPASKQDQPTPPKVADAGTCPSGDATGGVGIFVSPEHPRAGKPLTIVAATLEDERLLAIRVEQGGRTIDDATITHTGGVPSAAIARIASAPEGELTVVVGRDGTGAACARVKVGTGRTPSVRGSSADGVWPIARAWTDEEEALYSAWVRALFDAPRGEELARAALHELTSDAGRNLLHDHLGWGEDAAPKAGLHLKPDCADTPYFLRAYYSWKRGLPFGFRGCSRGGPGKAPRCGKLRGVVGSPEAEPDGSKPGELGAVQKYFRRTLAWGVHTGNGRTAFGDDATDYYPVALTRRGLRPGTMYADPYGHVFVLVALVDPDGAEPGVLYAIDGQPDGSITRKRFWEGNFLWNPDPGLGGSGFKAARPVDVVRQDGASVIVAASDAEIARRPGYGDVSDEQRSLDAPAFYDRMDGLITPGRRDATRAQAEAIAALLEAAKVRVTSVNNGEGHFSGGGGVISMPSGHAIFETTGAWENFATPARDLRLLIAIDVVLGFGDKVRRNPSAFGDAAGMDALVARLESERKAALADPKLAFEYTRSDGSTWTLTLGELVQRASSFEMAYNPNDCPELRWGAPAGSDEASTCRRRAPDEQRRKMKAYRVWFHERRRPARGDPGPAAE